ncbi:MAG: UDP-N-acetylglucosamine--N-acetylmuramyl-(pentapeptide) pyrophosphoryl-undecaprenol N-acetylglucosamine transferase [Alphaproteobacteria bacterium]
MKVMMTGGGTAGHVTPLLAVASELKKEQPSASIRYIGNYGDSFGHLVKNSNDFDKSYLIFAGKFRRYHKISKLVYLKDPRITLKNIRDLFLFLFGFIQSIAYLVFWRPDVIFVKGGFVGLPVGLAGAFLRIPVVTHDSDAVPGLTNRILSRYSKLQAVAMPIDSYKYNKKTIRLTGLPINEDIVAITAESEKNAKKHLGIKDTSFVVSFIGGSLGALRLNNAVQQIAKEYLSGSDERIIIHVTGKAHFKAIQNSYNQFDESIRKKILVFSYTNDLKTITAASDIVVSRAGSSIHELSAQQKCVILVPNPILTGGHQTKNAELIKANQAGIVVDEKELERSEGGVLLNEILLLENDKNLRKNMAMNLSMLAVPHAAKNIVGVLMEAINKNV